MTDLIALTERLISSIEWQLVPVDMTVDDCIPFVVEAIEFFYIMAGKALQYSDDLVVIDEEAGTAVFMADFQMDERQYILTTAMILFYQKVQSDVNELMSYTTDAMSVANADKPFGNLAGMIDNLKERQLMIWHKMTRYNLL